MVALSFAIDTGDPPMCDSAPRGWDTCAGNVLSGEARTLPPAMKLHLTKRGRPITAPLAPVNIN